ncbi:12707_t:CDS:2 [Racocetra persica]|uniref:12707_t:CDS:1 n=1 Tax=Racocetra persica TaxID=160502 RepID=A0ACA9KUB8_9GLOM|nr:12707_t:CDS:2 [Racocetra persica]
MSAYDDFFARAHIGDKPVLPKPANVMGSPDIQPVGTEPIANPNEYFIGKDGKEEEYEKDKGTDITKGERNYIYLRGSSTLETEGYAELYFVPSSLVMHPNATDQHNCLVSRFVTERNPNEVPTDFSDWNALIKWVQESPGIGWRNIHFADPKLPEKETIVDLNIPHGWDMHSALVYLETVDMPVGVTVSFFSVDINPPFKLEPQEITYPNQSFFVIASLPTGHTGKVTYKYVTNSKTIPDDAKLHLKIGKLTPIGSVTSVFKSS